MTEPKTTIPRAEREIWSVKDVCEHFDCSRPHVYKLMDSQGLPHMHLGALLRFRRDDVITWQNAQVTQVKKKGAA